MYTSFLFFHEGVKDAIVIDIGGTTSDAGCLMGGFPKEASARIKVGGVTTNFRMPDVVSIGLGGGSKIRCQESGDGVSCIVLLLFKIIIKHQ